MSFRKTRKFKEKPVVFAFGHIMLPLVAILALGLLVLGVRLLFVTRGARSRTLKLPRKRSPKA